ncbi:MAG: mandelate racemase/muconate lactonizing enzyme family protein [Ectothiorhodospiraceae bacterium]|nr:mandelate racemase/muconate lactonizing enzyme family protein [Ectothiorhodospiraceae bacterium]
MKIARVESIPLSVPFDAGASTPGFEGSDWRKLNVLLVRVETEDGLVGWGDAFSYNCMRAVRAAVDDMVAPGVIGQDAGDIAGIARRLQQALHLFGRYGITMFALSGLDIALWDLAGKAAGMPLHRLLGGAVRNRIPAYASLFRYRVPEVVAERCAAALADGFRHVKLHETREPEIEAARDALGPGVPMMIDTNCPWTPTEALAHARLFEDYDPYWLEEPIFPPEDFAALARLRAESGLPIAAGENACTAYEFEKMLAAEAVTFAQPSVTKVGGITEMMRIAALVRARGVSLMPHSPYFGPGFLATLQVAAALPEESLIERFYLQPEGSLYGDWIDAVDGHFRVPDGPGLGVEPDPDVIRAYRVEGS